MASLLGTWHRLTATWAALQVERQGKYSLERLRQFHNYQSSTSLARVWTVIVLTPLPCLAVVTLIDAIPLQPPSLGLEHSQLFWLRALMMSTIVYLTITVQLRLIVTRLPVTSAQILRIPFVVALLVVALTIWTSYLVVYPLPFSIAFGSPITCGVFAICIYAVWGKFLKENREVRGELFNYFTLVVKQVSLLYIYALFSYVFNNLASPIGQTVFALFLPVLKLACKNWINRSLMHQVEDLKPELIIFNVEVFHALNVAFSMQNAASKHTIVVLMVVDCFHACASLRRFSRLAESWTANIRVPSETSIASSSLAVGTAAVKPWKRRVAPLRDSRCVDTSPQLLRIVLLILEADRSLSNSKALVHLGSKLHHPSASLGPEPPPSRWTGSKESVPKQRADKAAKSPSIPRPPSIVSIASLPGTIAEPEVRQTEVKDKERVQNALQLLHMTEFFVLVEYTEVMIPVLYCLYLLVMRHLPNRVYYAQLKDVDDTKLKQNIGNILLYGLLELVSFLLLSWFLRRKLKISPIYQLAFVLERQWSMVQSKLILWVVLTVQSSLEHFGADYSFQFKWLHQRQ